MFHIVNYRGYKFFTLCKSYKGFILYLLASVDMAEDTMESKELSLVSGPETSQKQSFVLSSAMHTLNYIKP